MKFTLAALLILAPLSASAEIVKMRCECGHNVNFGGHPSFGGRGSFGWSGGMRWVHRGFVDLSADEDNYWPAAKRACRKKFKVLEIEASNCQYAE